MFKCQECGKKFKTTSAAQSATYNGCPKCGGSDIDVDTAPAAVKTRKPAALATAPDELIATTDGIRVKAYDVLQISVNGGDFSDFSTIRDRGDASAAVNLCRSGSFMANGGDVRRYRIVRKGLDAKIVYVKVTV